MGQMKRLLEDALVWWEDLDDDGRNDLIVKEYKKRIKFWQQILGEIEVNKNV